MHKARENKYQVREFKWDDDASANQKEELERLEKEEKELWVSCPFEDGADIRPSSCACPG